jgi:hypothetical protein
VSNHRRAAPHRTEAAMKQSTANLGSKTNFTGTTASGAKRTFALPLATIRSE